MGIASLDEVRDLEREGIIAKLIDNEEKNKAFKELFDDYLTLLFISADGRLMEAKKQKGSIVAGDNSLPSSPET